MLPRFTTLVTRLTTHSRFALSQDISALKRQKEANLVRKIKDGLDPTFIKVDDISGMSSCGQMYNIMVESPQFEGKSKVKQHQMVTACIKDELSKIHGYNLKTKAPEKEGEKL